MSLDDEIAAMFETPVTEKKSAKDEVLAQFEAALTNAETVEIDEEVNVDSDPEVLAAIEQAKAEEAKVAEAEQNLLESRRALNNIDEQTSALASQVRELNAKIAALNAERMRISTAGHTMDRRRDLNAAQRNLDQAQKNITVVRQKVELRAKTLKTVEAYTRIAEKMPWYKGFDLNDKVVKVMDFQWEGIKFLANASRGILADEMGLGKTIMAVAALDLVRSKRALVICPAEVTSNFLREVKRWAPHRKVVNIKGQTKAQRNAVLEMVPHFEPVVVIVNYEAWRKDLSLLDRLVNIQFDTLIADEAHMVKGTNTDAFSGVKQIAHTINTCPYGGELLDDGYCAQHNYHGGSSVSFITDGMDESQRMLVGKSVKNLWLMTGTPILNAPEDLYSMLHLIDPYAFSHKSRYLNDYCQMNYMSNRWEFRSGGLESLTKRLSGRYLARTLESAGVELPPQDIVEHLIEFDEETYLKQQDVIQQLAEHAQIVLSEDNKTNAMEVLALITRQRQANVWPAAIQVWDYPRDELGFPDKTAEKIKIFDGSEIQESIKLDKVVELIYEFVVVEGKRVALFSQFTTALEELDRRLHALDISSVRFDGKTPNSVKDAIKTNFDKSNGEPAKWSVVLANYKSGGVGLNLTAATHTIILDEEWNPGKRNQAYKRTQRMGQDENTIVHVLRVAHTVDSWLEALINEKEDLINGFDSATGEIQQAILDAIKDGEF